MQLLAISPPPFTRPSSSSRFAYLSLPCSWKSKSKSGVSCFRRRHGTGDSIAPNFSSPLPGPIRCRLLGRLSGSDIISQLPKKRRKPDERVIGIFWILLLNLGIYAADHLFKFRSIKIMYLYHNFPVWYQFVTATFCHANWSHLSSNLFFLYIFGKLVEEEEGNFALWVSYILTGAGANLISWLVLPRNTVSIGASGAVFGLFAVSVLVKMSWDWRKILEVLILGQFVIGKVLEAAEASTGLSGRFSLQKVNHIAHLSGALVGVFLVWLLSKVPSQIQDQEALTMHRKTKSS